MSHVFVTGSRGLVGSHLVPRLIEMQYKVETDLRYLHSRKYEAVIHLAARTNIGVDFDPDIYESNILLTKEVFKCSCRIVAASSCSAAHLTNPYAYSKRYLEHLCSIHPNAVALRFFNVYGCGASRGIIWWLMQQPDGVKISVRGPELVRDYIVVDDVVDEIVKHLELPGIWVDVEALKSIDPKDALENLFNTGVLPSLQPVIETQKIYDVGSGTGWQTMDVVNLYQELSGKRFDISVSEAGSNEPLSMISNRVCGTISLKQGLLKLIKNGN